MLPVLALQPYEIALLVLVVFVLFGGATQIPKIARALGRAKGEYQSARKDFEGEVTRAQQETQAAPRQEPSPGPEVTTGFGAGPAHGVEARPPPADEDEVRRAAQAMGISTEGRSIQDLKAEMNKRLG